MRRWLTVTLASLALAAGACESSSNEGASSAGNGAAPQALLTSANETAEARSSKVAFSVVIRGASNQAVGDYTITGEGGVDFTARQAALLLDFPPVGPIQVGRVDSLVDGTIVYLKYPPQAAQAAGLGGKVWAKMDIVERSSAVNADLSAIIQAVSGDPGQALHLLRGAVADVKEVGREQIRGEDTTHYRGTFDVAKAAASAPPERQAALRQLAQLYGAQPVAGDAWIDADGRLRKITYSVDLDRLNLPAQSRKLTGNLTLTAEFFDFGAPVTVTFPPPDQVFDVAASPGRGG